jgi:hypothetical protein
MTEDREETQPFMQKQLEVEEGMKDEDLRKYENTE